MYIIQIQLVMYRSNMFVNDFVKYNPFLPHFYIFLAVFKQSAACGVCPDIAFVPLQVDAATLLGHNS